MRKSAKLVNTYADFCLTKRKGVEIIEPDKLLDMPESQLHLIICSIHYKAIAKQLEGMGIKKYKVYVQEREWILDDEQER